MRRSFACREVLLIGVAGLLFPEELLNDEGVNRLAATPTGVED